MTSLAGDGDHGVRASIADVEALGVIASLEDFERSTPVGSG